MEFLDYKIFDNTVRDLLIVLGVIIVAILLARTLSWALARFTTNIIKANYKLAQRQKFGELIIKPLALFIAVVVSLGAIDRLYYPAAWEIKIYRTPLSLILERIGVVIMVILFTRLMLRGIDFIAYILGEKAARTLNKNDDQLIIFFRDFLKVLAVVGGIILFIKAGLNRPVGPLLTGLSIVGAALALAAKESLENLIASFVIFFDKPFYVGDTLKVNTITGRVERIGLRSTRIRTPDKTLVTVPNKQMVDGIVDNWSMRSQRRAEIKLELALKNHSDRINTFLQKAKEILGQNKDVITDCSVYVTDFNRNGMTVTIEFFTKPVSLAEFNVVRQEVMIALKISLEKLGISMLAGSDVNIEVPEVPQPPRNQPLI